MLERLETAMSMLDIFRQVRTTQQPVTIFTLVRFDIIKYKSFELQVGTCIYLDKYLKIGKLADMYLDHSMSGNLNTFINNTLLNAVKKLSKHKFYKKILNTLI